jgi:predicted AlkP superfamily pyrophosphatase or phosphodiesterase
MKAQKKSAGVIDGNKLGKNLEAHLDSVFGTGKYIAAFSSDAVNLNDSVFISGKLNRNEIESAVKIFLKNTEGIADVFSADELYDNGDSSLRSMLSRGVHPTRKADIYFVMQPNWMDYTETGTTHGSGYDYDTHVPLLFWGGKIRNGFSEQYHSITDIAPTVCIYLGITFPSGSTGKVITEILGN